MKAVVIGSGRVACGFLAPLLLDSGYEVVLLGRRPEIIAALNRGRYRLDICHPDGSVAPGTIDGVRAARFWNVGSLANGLSGARIIFTAVGAPGLKDLAAPISSAILHALPTFPPDGVDIISCSNMPNAIALLREAMQNCAPPAELETVEHTVRFRRAMVWRIISNRGLAADGLRLRADDVHRIDIECPLGWSAPPPIKGALAWPRMGEAIYEKLHVFNSGHAVAGYLGYLRGFHYIHDALKDCVIAETVDRALREASSWQSGLEENGHHPKRMRTFLARYGNPALRDPTTRVAARPLQKLGPFERLVLPAWFSLTFGKTPIALADTIAAALRFDCRQDAEAVQLQARIRESGVEQTLEEVCGLRPTDELTQMVLPRYEAQGTVPALRRNGHTPGPSPADQSTSTVESEHIAHPLPR